ncbi:MAG: UDP-N-acetylmuramoyl-L-alanyl-D-glutamate--2,6-diaminopimelate ligase [Fimbriimonadaceae bacterium]|nr:UDP-N-acetylmuramoyl-L-alanyl-D-glutamate--2,6-diaminopimelate ligase [Fimbriimonadaceae bacterium]
MFPAVGGLPDIDVSGIHDDSRRVARGDLFVCQPSSRIDTHQFLPQARERGAVAAVVHSESGAAIAECEGIAAVQLPQEAHDFNKVLGMAWATYYGDPTGSMQVVGITGTNGKTTTAWMVHEALTALGNRSAYLGTLGLRRPSNSRSLENTTPFPVELAHLIQKCKEDGVTHLAMEVSSHGLEEERIAGVRFDVGVFTNLSQDHLDYHGTLESYAAAKKRLFWEVADRSGKPFVSAICVADPLGARWAEELRAAGRRLLTFGTPSADVELIANSVTASQIKGRLRLGSVELELALGVGGSFNVDNATSAAAALVGLGLSPVNVVRGLEAVKPVPGRFESVANEAGFDILVDYAHTPDALRKLLQSVRALSPKRIITVFGCGGDRDRSKRPKMAAAVSEFSDQLVVTSDNPRTEDPTAIIREIVVGIPHGTAYEAIVDRGEGIARAVELAEPGDIVVIAGKGHEDYQIIGRTKHPMDDRELARSALRSRGALR